MASTKFTKGNMDAIIEAYRKDARATMDIQHEARAALGQGPLEWRAALERIHALAGLANDWNLKLGELTGIEDAYHAREEQREAMIERNIESWSKAAIERAIAR
ncbi:MAG: hypothetical protein JSR49_11950 [Proteobacteria bacterium]|nr:hypothetical protein [Pseudomonadota bacterium]